MTVHDPHETSVRGFTDDRRSGFCGRNGGHLVGQRGQQSLLFKAEISNEMTFYLEGIPHKKSPNFGDNARKKQSNVI